MAHRAARQSQARREAICQRLVGNRRLAARVFVDNTDGRMGDSARIQALVDKTWDGQHVDGVPLSWQAYWTDASVVEDRLGASVVKVLGVTKVNGHWAIASDAEHWHLGRYSGKSVDAELFGIAAALEMAVAEYHSREGALRRVHVYSDAATILSALDASTCRVLGPITASAGPLAIQQVYDRADELMGLGVDVELHWVKAHAGTDSMNDRADRAARLAAGHPPPWSPDASREGHAMEMWREVPQAIADMGADVVEEWRYRGNGVDGELEDAPMDMSSDED